MSVSDESLQKKDALKVYVAGPYTRPDPCENTHKAIVAANRLWDNGFIPYVPHLTHFWHTVTPRPYSDWLAYDLAFLPVCDVFLRLPGESSGADGEEAEAERLGMPIYHDIDELIAKAKAA
jgi:hypothetical protein